MNEKKLSLNRETIRNLSDENLELVAGGGRKNGGGNNNASGFLLSCISLQIVVVGHANCN